QVFADSDDFEINLARDGEEALASVQESLPDAILLDGMMPKLDGFAVTRRLRADPRTRDVPIILVTGMEGEEDIAEAIAAGISDYVQKPFAPAYLRELVMAWLEHRAEPSWASRESSLA